jgi:hypothetical protein
VLGPVIVYPDYHIKMKSPLPKLISGSFI